MSNLNRGGGGAALPLLVAAVFALLSTLPAECGEVHWQLLTKLNYTSQIGLHPRILLLVTVPWCGESRSLMKALARAVESDIGRFGTLKLMVLFRNQEKMLADALGSSDGMTILYYHNNFSYKYRGKLRVQNILSSVHYVMSLSPDDLPLKSIASLEELRDFLDSTDKAVLLFEFCGWSRILLTVSNNNTGNNHDFSGESNGTFTIDEKDNRKDMEDDKFTCGIQDEFSAASWLNQFASANDSPSETENSPLSAGVSCTLDEFHQFESFLQNFIPVVREFFLPPERIRFALVNESSLLPFLNIEEQGSWFMTVLLAGCPNCSKFIREGDDLRTVFQTQTSLVHELEDDIHEVEAILPAKWPSILLFIDRSSNTSQIKRESQRALSAFRELADYYKRSNHILGEVIRSEKSSMKSIRALQTNVKRPGLLPVTALKKLMVNDKMSIMVMNEGQQITLENLIPDLQGSSMHEILTYALKQKKEQKLSSLAKDAGFQLLSKDFDIELVESLQEHNGEQSYKFLGEPPLAGSFESALNLDKSQKPAVGYREQQQEVLNPYVTEHIPLEDKRDSLYESRQSYLEPVNDPHEIGIATDVTQGQNVMETSRSGIYKDKTEKEFSGSFLFLDGQYRFLETLTGGSKMPSVVIIDPTSLEHYVLDEHMVLSYSSLFGFVNQFLDGKLPPHQQSSSSVPSPRVAPRPPFVNLDFHETDSVPRVNIRTFAQLVLGNISDSRNSGGAWDENVLVLFTNSWCGFCQRMEIVVREVWRAIKGSMDMKMHSSRKGKWIPTGEHAEDVTVKLPLIYIMDCTENDCSSIIKPILQREVYPLLLLFPAEKKNTLSYEGDITVSDIIKFLAAHGSNLLDLILDKTKQGPLTRNLHHKVLLKDRLQNIADKDVKTNVDFRVGSHERAPLSSGFLLSATEKLMDVHPFDESKVLIVKADQNSGFEGLIINKHISWDSLEELEEGFELLKEAPLSFGGPVVRRGMPLVALMQKFGEDQSLEVLPNIYFIDHLATHGVLEEIRVGNQSVRDYWFFLGHSSWGWEQLYHEVAVGAWNVSQGSLEQLEWPLR